VSHPLGIFCADDDRHAHRDWGPGRGSGRQCPRPCRPPRLPARLGLNSRTDLIYERDELVRVQCKTARLLDQVLGFRTCSNTGNLPRAYDGEIDEFGVYSPDLNLVYLVPAVGLPTRFCSLRLAPTRNGQAKGVWWAEQYILGPP
jgi:hypothetical protein